MERRHERQPDAEERRVMTDRITYRETDGGATISGYAAVFNSETTIGGGFFGFREIIAPGAFTDAIPRDDVRALFNHDPNMLLGRTVSGTLTLSQDKRGLKYAVDLPDTAAARDVRTLIKRGDVSGSSFGFIVTEDDWDESEVKAGKLPLRTIRSVELYDVSPVTYPAYPKTSVSARSRAQAAIEGRPMRLQLETPEPLPEPEPPSDPDPVPAIDLGLAHRAAARKAIEDARKAWGA